MAKQETQMRKIVTVMIRNKNQEWFMAGDFQSPKIDMRSDLFVGWEATARMSDLHRTYPEMVEAKRIGKYRYLRFRFENTIVMFKLLSPGWITFIKSELEQNGITYKAEQKIYEPVEGKNAVREIKTEIDIIPAPTRLSPQKGLVELGEGKFIVQGRDERRYHVENLGKGWDCECEAFRFSREKICKHIKEVGRFLAENDKKEAERLQNKLL